MWKSWLRYIGGGETVAINVICSGYCVTAIPPASLFPSRFAEGTGKLAKQGKQGWVIFVTLHFLSAGQTTEYLPNLTR